MLPEIQILPVYRQEDEINSQFRSKLNATVLDFKICFAIARIHATIIRGCGTERLHGSSRSPLDGHSIECHNAYANRNETLHRALMDLTSLPSFPF